MTPGINGYTGSDPSAFYDRMFKKADTNGDGTISKDEFSAMFANRPDASSGQGPSVDQLFAQADTNGDGSIDASENAAFLQAHRHHHAGGGHHSHPPQDPSAIASAIMSAGDTNGDGVLSQDELLSTIKQALAAQQSQTAYARAGQADAASTYQLQA